MSSTRRAQDDSIFHQNRYASSPEFERGLSGYLVAKRTAIMDRAADRELIWALHSSSHQAGGLDQLARDLISAYPGRIQTPAMLQIGAKAEKNLNPEQVRKIRDDMPEEMAASFPLKGETLIDAGAYGLLHSDDLARLGPDPRGFPAGYSAGKFIICCRHEAESKLPNYLRELCLNPALNLKAGPWYFPGLIETLREHQAAQAVAKSAGVVVTSLGRKIHEVLDYTFFSRGLTLMEGEARRGKSFAARIWCEAHPGQARFIEVPTGNDESGFFRELARGLGIGNFLQYKVAEIRARVEAVLRTGNLLLVLDEAHRLWPQKNLRYGFPSRINWIMSMANHNIPICCISTPQFIEMQKAAEAQGRWNSAQLTGRISHYEPLPAALTADDLQAVAKAVLPEANAQVLRVLADYARASDRYLAAIDSISKRARFNAARAGRDQATSEDVRWAMKESVIPADSRLLKALESGRKSSRRSEMFPPAELPEPVISAPRRVPAEDLQPERSRLSGLVPGSRVRAGSEASLIEA